MRQSGKKYSQSAGHLFWGKGLGAISRDVVREQRPNRDLIRGSRHRLRHRRVMSCLTTLQEFFEDTTATTDKGNLVGSRIF